MLSYIRWVWMLLPYLKGSSVMLRVNLAMPQLQKKKISDAIFNVADWEVFMLDLIYT